jgi:hypothetical protein
MAQLLPSSEGVQGATGKPPWSPPQRRKLLKNRKKKVKLFPLPATRNPFLVAPIHFNRDGPRRFPKGEQKALWSPPQRRKLLKNRKKKVKLFPLPSTRNPFLEAPIHFNRDGPRRFPKGDRKALWSPPQRRNLLRNRKRK